MKPIKEQIKEFVVMLIICSIYALVALVSGNACTFTFLIQRILRIVKNFEFADGTGITSNELFSTPLTITSNSEIKDFSYEFRRREANLF